MMNSEEKTMNMEDTTPVATPQFATSSNELNNPPMEPDLAQYVKKRLVTHLKLATIS